MPDAVGMATDVPLMVRVQGLEPWVKSRVEEHPELSPVIVMVQLALRVPVT